MILVYYTTDLCELVFQNFNPLLKILVMLLTARVEKQLFQYGNLIGYHVPAIDFV